MSNVTHGRQTDAAGDNPQGKEAVKRQAEDAAREANQQAKQAAEELKQKGAEIAEDVKQKADDTLREQRQRAAGQVGGVAGALRDTAGRLDDEQQWMAGGIRRAADALDGVAERLRDEDLNGAVRRLADYTRREPAVVLGTAAVAGFLLARFMKSSASRDEHGYAGARSGGREEHGYAGATSGSREVRHG